MNVGILNFLCGVTTRSQLFLSASSCSCAAKGRSECPCLPVWLHEQTHLAHQPWLHGPCDEKHLSSGLWHLPWRIKINVPVSQRKWAVSPSLGVILWCFPQKGSSRFLLSPLADIVTYTEVWISRRRMQSEDWKGNVSSCGGRNTANSERDPILL